MAGRKNRNAPKRNASPAADGDSSEASDGSCNNWVYVAGALGVVVAIAASLQFTSVASAMGLGGGVRSLDLEGDGAIRAAMTSGEPWMLFCDEDISRRKVKGYWKAKETFGKVAAELSGQVAAGMLDCSKPLEGSGKTVYGYVGLPVRGYMPATVLVAANGRKARKVPPAFLKTAKKLAKFVADRTATKTVDAGTKRGLSRCLSARTCVILAHSGAKGRRPVKAVVADAMAQHRTAQFATLDTSKAWISGLPRGVVAVMPRSAAGQPENATATVTAGNGKRRNATVTGWGRSNAAEDAMGQAVVVLRRDPRPRDAKEPGSKPADGKKHSRRVLLTTWVGASDASFGSGRMLLSRSAVNDALRTMDEAETRAAAFGGLSGGAKASDAVRAVMEPQQAAAEALLAATGGRSGVAAAAKHRVSVMPAPRAPRAPRRKPSAAGMDADTEAKVIAAAQRRAVRERRREQARKLARERGEDPDEAAAEVDAAGETDAEQRAREAMERDAAQWIPQGVEEEADEEDDESYEEDAYEEDDEAGFEEVA